MREPKLLDLKEVAARLDYSYQTVRNIIQDPNSGLHGVRFKDAGKWKVRDTDLERFIEKRYAKTEETTFGITDMTKFDKD